MLSGTSAIFHRSVDLTRIGGGLRIGDSGFAAAMNKMRTAIEVGLSENNQHTTQYCIRDVQFSL
jgi:hypothetical protein